MSPVSPGSYYNAEGDIIYNGGVLRNWSSPNGNRKDAQFIDTKGHVTEFPGVSFSPPNSTIHAKCN